MKNFFILKNWLTRLQRFQENQPDKQAIDKLKYEIEDLIKRFSAFPDEMDYIILN